MTILREKYQYSFVFVSELKRRNLIEDASNLHEFSVDSIPNQLCAVKIGCINSLTTKLGFY